MDTSNRFAMEYPALNGDVVCQGHSDYCRDHGHATYTLDGIDQGWCPRCGEQKPQSTQAVSNSRT